MGLFIKLLKLTFKILIYFVVFIAVILLVPNLPPYTKFTAIKIEPTQSRTGALAPNRALNNAEKLFTNKLLGPEAFRIYNGELYTGLATGEVVKISPGGHITFVTKIGQPCTGLSQEQVCGRPLGLEIDEKNNVLYVADAYYGIWKVNLKNDKKQLLVSPNVEIDGKLPKIFNGIALDKSGNLYWTHSSSDYDLKDGALTPLSDPSGRLFFYNSKTNKSSVLLDNLWFPNGVVISSDSQFVLVSESNHYRVVKYYINGPKKGKTEVFAAGLPGIPDNLQVLPDGSGVLVSLYVTFDDENPLISRTLAATPLARKFLARLIRMIEIPLEFLYEQYPHVILEEITYKIGHFSSMSGIVPQMSGILQLDWNGKIVASYFNTDKSIGTASDAVVYNDKLYIGSPHSPYIGAVAVPPSLKKAFSNSRSASASAASNAEVKKTQSKVDSATPTKSIKNPEKEKVKVAEKIDLPKVPNLPTVQKSPEPVPTQKPSEKQPSMDSQQVKKETKESRKPDKVEAKQNKPDPETKPKTIETKPIKQETISKPKTVETKPIKETEPKIVETKPIKEEAKPKTVETKLNKKETEKKSKPVESKSIKQESVTKPKPVEKESTKHESKTKPEPASVEPKSTRPKQQTVSPKEKENVKSKLDPKIVEGKEAQSKNSKESDIKQNVVQSEPVKAPKVDHAKGEVKTSQSTTNKNKDKIKINTPNAPQIPIPDQIPVKEEIPSDRMQPAKETLKVIKKTGPVEIPNPN